MICKNLAGLKEIRTLLLIFNFGTPAKTLNKSMKSKKLCKKIGFLNGLRVIFLLLIYYELKNNCK
jgi:hypothetical protein